MQLRQKYWWKGKTLGDMGRYSDTCDELLYFNICCNPFAHITRHTIFDLNRAMPVWVKSYKVKGGTNDISLDVTQKWGRRWSYLFPIFSVMIKMQPSLFSGLCILCQPARVSHKCPVLINSLFACHFASSWILFVMRQETGTSVSPNTRWEVLIKRKIFGEFPCGSAG